MRKFAHLVTVLAATAALAPIAANAAGNGAFQSGRLAACSQQTQASRTGPVSGGRSIYRQQLKAIHQDGSLS